MAASTDTPRTYADASPSVWMRTKLKADA
eukprot:COSAG06_NODE_63160_length_263_cov_0.621951_1_plen_28_part_01